MKNTAEINPTEITIINDGQFRYPVSTDAMSAWIAANGEIKTANYDKFCADVECIGEREHGTPGNPRMLAYCDSLIAAGADYVTLS